MTQMLIVDNLNEKVEAILNDPSLAAEVIDNIITAAQEDEAVCVSYYKIDPMDEHLPETTKRLMLYGMAFKDKWCLDDITVIVDNGEDSSIEYY